MSAEQQSFRSSGATDLQFACKFRCPAISLTATLAKAGVHSSESTTPVGWAPAFAGVASEVGGPAILAKLGRQRPAFRLQIHIPGHLPHCHPGESRGQFVRQRDAARMGPGFRRGGE
jgi:hypothetical protein